MRPEVAAAIAELEGAFAGRVHVEAEDASGATVRIAAVDLSERWAPRTGDLWLLVPYHYPDAAIYPYYVTGATPTNSVAALQPATWRGMQVTQVSLRHNGWNPAHDTALGSVVLTLAWLRAT